MARPLRIEYPGALYHLTTRGNARDDIFFSDRDRQLFLDILGEVCERLQWLCYAYCLMSNHYHLIIETPEANLSKGMRQLNGVYTQRFNRCHGRSGHLFQGRYKSILVDRDAYLLEVSRYVVLNPVRARMVHRPEQWPWSSYGATAGTAQTPKWLAHDVLLSHFSRRRVQAHERYIQFVLDGVTQSNIWDGLQQQIYLGDDQFIIQIQSRLRLDDALDEVPRVQRQQPPPSLQTIAREHADRVTAMAAAYLSGAYTMKAIAAYFGVHYSTVSRAIKQANSDKVNDETYS